MRGCLISNKSTFGPWAVGGRMTPPPPHITHTPHLRRPHLLAIIVSRYPSSHSIVYITLAIVIMKLYLCLSSIIDCRLLVGRSSSEDCRSRCLCNKNSTNFRQSSMYSINTLTDPPITLISWDKEIGSFGNSTLIFADVYSSLYLEQRSSVRGCAV